MKTLHITVQGEVQGVGYRFYTQTVAKQLGLLGWVRNEYNGTVTVEATGDDNQLTTFISYLKEGPRFAHVESLTVEEKPFNHDHHIFYIKH